MITIAHRGEEFVVKNPLDPHTLAARCANECNLLSAHVVGFKRKDQMTPTITQLIPLSRAANAGAEFLATTKAVPLELVINPTPMNRYILNEQQVRVPWEGVELLADVCANASTLHQYLSSFSSSRISPNDMFEAIHSVIPNEAQAARITRVLGMFASRAEVLQLLSQLPLPSPETQCSKSSAFTYCRLFLTLVCAVALEMAEEDYMDESIRHAISETANLLLSLMSSRIRTWRNFVDWYKHSGRESFPFLELAVFIELGGMRLAGSDVVAVEETSKNVVFDFVLAPGCGSLQITRQDVAALYKLVTLTELCCTPAETIVSLFCDAATDHGTLSKPAFDACVSKLLPRIHSKQDEIWVQFVLSNIFFAFDRAGTREVPVDEFCTGFSLLCQGKKSSKLQLAFALFALDDEVLPLDFARFIRSILTILFALNESAAQKPAAQIYKAIDQTTALATRSLLATLAKSTKGDGNASISFEGFANFYNTQGGHRLLPFVELLDVSKFPFSKPLPSTRKNIQGATAAAPEPVRQKSHKSTISQPTDHQQQHQHQEEEEPLFMFPISRGNVLRVSHYDADALLHILNTTQFFVVQASEVHARLFSVAYRGAVKRTDFMRLVLSLCVTWNPLVERFFDGLFRSYDRESKDEARLKELAAGVSVLCAGKKSEKLVLAFTRFDEDGDGKLARDDFARFFRSFLTVLFYFTTDGKATAPEKMWQIVDGSALDLADRICAHFRTSEVSFDDLALWYGEGGFNVASFLELLDVVGGKWTFEPTVTEPPRRVTSPRDIIAGLAQEKESNNTVFQFDLSAQHRLVVTPDDVRFVGKLAWGSGLAMCTVETLWSSLTSHADLDDGRKISEDAFQHAISAAVGGGGGGRLANRTNIDLMDAITAIYDMANRNPGRGVSLNDLVGIIILCKGTKSLKLAHAWTVLDEDHDSRLDRRGLYGLLRAFLMVLHALNFGANTTEMESVWHILDDCAGELAANIFLGAKRKHKSAVSFEEFAQYYSESGGYEMAPWLELLNLDKFVGRFQEEIAQWTSTPNVATTTTANVANHYNHHNENDQHAVFVFQITPSGERLQISSQDVDAISYCMRESRVGQLEPQELVTALVAAIPTEQDERMLQEETFGRFIGSVILAGHEDRVDDRIARFCFRLFTAFDRTDSSRVDFIPFAVGLLILASGSKSSKLSLAWALFAGGQALSGVDIDQVVSGLDQASFSAFLQAILTGIAAFSGFFEEQDDPWAIVSEACDHVAQVVFDSFPEPRSNIVFEEFANWYTNQGFEMMSWIELLSLPKWKDGAAGMMRRRTAAATGAGGGGGDVARL